MPSLHFDTTISDELLKMQITKMMLNMTMWSDADWSEGTQKQPTTSKDASMSHARGRSNQKRRGRVKDEANEDAEQR